MKSTFIILSLVMITGCGQPAQFHGLRSSQAAIESRYGKAQFMNTPSKLHSGFAKDTYHKSENLVVRVNYMGDSAENIMLLKMDNGPFSDKELEALLKEYADGKTWNDTGSYPNGGRIWQRTDACVAKYSVMQDKHAVEMMTTETLKLFTVDSME